MPVFNKSCLGLLCALFIAGSAQAAKLSIVIDDFGYRPHEENQVLAMPLNISIAVLPNAPYAKQMAIKAHSQGREILIHLPMAPLSKQPLERDTLQPNMSDEEIQRIIRQAVNNVPYAVGLNNHMGSAMTSSLPGMIKVMRALENYKLYFLDSVTIGNTQASRAAAGTSVKVIKRKVFLDDTQNDADIRFQLNRAIQLARRTGSAIAIGHPHPATVRVLQQMLPQLPSDIVLVRPSSLLNEPQSSDSKIPLPPSVKPATKPPKPHFKGVGQCPVKLPAEKMSASIVLRIIGESLPSFSVSEFIHTRWQRWVVGSEDKTTKE